MLYFPTAQFLATSAQQRHVNGARFDAPVESDRRSWRSLAAAVFARETAGSDATRRPALARRATIRPSSV